MTLKSSIGMDSKFLIQNVEVNASRKKGQSDESISKINNFYKNMINVVQISHKKINTKNMNVDSNFMSANDIEEVYNYYKSQGKRFSMKTFGPSGNAPYTIKSVDKDELNTYDDIDYWRSKGFNQKDAEYFNKVRHIQITFYQPKNDKINKKTDTFVDDEDEIEID